MELSNIREHLKSQDVYIVEVPLRSKNGKYRQKQIRCMYLNQQTGTLLLMLSDVEDIVKGGPHRSLVEEQVVKNHGRCKYQKGSNAGPDIFSVTIQFHKNVNPLSNFINLYYTHAIPKIQPQPHLR